MTTRNDSLRKVSEDEQFIELLRKEIRNATLDEIEQQLRILEDNPAIQPLDFGSYNQGIAALRRVIADMRAGK